MDYYVVCEVCGYVHVREFLCEGAEVCMEAEVKLMCA